MSHKGSFQVSWNYVYTGSLSKESREYLDSCARRHATHAVKNGWVEGELYEYCGGIGYRGYWRIGKPKPKKKAFRCKFCGAKKPVEGHSWVDSGNGTVSCGGPGCIVF